MKYLNYLIEANLSLIFFYMVYWLLLRKENQFTIQRTVLVGGLLLSLVIPLVHFDTQPEPFQTSIPTLQETFPSYWLPELVVKEQNINIFIETRSASFWRILPSIYLLGCAIMLVIFIFQLYRLKRLKEIATYSLWNGFNVYGLPQDRVAFSFISSIFIGEGWTVGEKEKILSHEAIHINRYHSIDVLLVRIMGIVFWFNPIISLYQKSLSQLHEYEADYLSVDPKQADEFCRMLGINTLQKAGIPMEHHFSKSNTLKRIIMMQKEKTKVRGWKLISLGLLMSLIMVAIGCQDQVIQEMTTSTITQMGSYPSEVQTDLNQLRKEFPSETFTYVEGSKEDMAKMINETGRLNFVRKFYSFNREGANVSGAILSNVARHADQLQTSGTGEVFTIVEHSSSPKGGMIAFFEHIAANLKYPATARSAGVQGRVFIEFVVNQDGTLSDLKILKGIGEGCDEEAMRVVSSSPAWNPAMQKGKTVRQRMVLPITFKLDDVDNKEGK